MSTPTPVTQRDVAQACGVHPSTICLALNNSPSIPAETRRRIQERALALGYQPNAAARNLALLRTERKGGGSLPIAWINQEVRRDHWRTDAEARASFEGARRQAETMGYHLEELWTREPGMTAARLAQIVKTRGIEGVLFPVHRSFDFSLMGQTWDAFATVGLHDQRLGEWMDVVAADYHQHTALALRELRRAGMSRPGLVLTSQFDAASGGAAHGCFLRHQSAVAEEDRVPVCFVPEERAARAAAIEEWLRDYRPDAVLCREAGPESVGALKRDETLWVRLDAPGHGFAAGVEAGAGELAAAAVECVAGKMRRFERGLRGAGRLLLHKGAWRERRPLAFEASAVVA